MKEMTKITMEINEIELRKTVRKKTLMKLDNSPDKEFKADQSSLRWLPQMGTQRAVSQVPGGERALINPFKAVILYFPPA